MYRDAEIITELQQNLGTELAQSSVERVLRVPQAWEALREPEFLRSALEASGGQALFPSMLAALSLGFRQLTDALSSDEEEGTESFKSSALKQTAKQALELCRIQADVGNQGLIEFTANASNDWRSAFICAWPAFQEHNLLLESIAYGPFPALGDLIATTLRAYMSTQQAVAELLALKAESAFRLLPMFQNEPELYAALRDELSELSGLFKYDRDAQAEAASHDALILSQLGRTEEAHQAIRSAWDTATRQTALVADRLAEVARFDDDPIMEVEARQQAMEAYPTVPRSCLSAFSLLQVERYEEALNLVREGNTFEENVTAGLIFLTIQDTHTAGKRLNQAAQQCPEVSVESPEWFLHLANGLKSIGFSIQAIRVYEHLIDRYPARADLRTSLAELLNEIGDIDGAIQHASVAVSLTPQDFLAREMLASSLEQIGNPKAALPHWELIAEDNVVKNIQLGECALEAGDPVIAKRAAERVLEADPDHVDALVLVGRALSTSGKHSEAKSILSDVTNRSPEVAQAWIALAESLEATDETELAGQKIQDALNILPDHPELHMARSAWLKSMGRITDALNHSKIAISAYPERTDWRMQHAKLLVQLGRHDEAKATLEEIVSNEPANWNAMEQLARTHEQLEDLPSALALVRCAPEEIEPDSAIYVGRLLAEAGDSIEDHQKAKSRLSEAKKAGVEDTSIEYWLGVAEFKQNEFQPAAKHLLRYLEAVKDSEAEHYLDAAVSFAYSALEIGETTLALTQLEKVKPSFPTSLDLLVTLSEAQYRSGDREKSLHTAREALELHPDSQEALGAFKWAAERAGQLQEAIEAQRKLTALAPENPDHWLDMARIEQNRGETSASRAALAKAITLGRQDAKVLATAAECAQGLKCTGLEIRLLKRAASLAEHNVAYHEMLARAASKSGELETAAEAWIECARMNPKEVATLLPAAKSLWALNRRTAAIGLLQQAVNIAPDDTGAHYELGRALLAMGDLGRGIDEINKAASLDPEDSILRARVAILLAKFATPEDGLSLLTGSIPVGKFPDVPEARAICHWMNGNLVETEKALGTIPAAIPLSTSGIALRTLTKLASGDSVGAQREFDQIHGKNISSSSDLEWAIKAGLALLDAPQTIGLVETFKQSHPVEPEALLIEIQARILVENLTWLFSTLANSTIWTPLSDQVESNQKLIDRALSAYEAADAPEKVLESVRQLAQITAGQSRPDGLETEAPVFGLGSAFVKQCLAIALLRANRPSKVIKWLDALPSEPYDQSLCALLQGLAYSSSAQNESAAASFQLASEFASLKPLAYYFEAKMWEKAGAYERAISSMNEAIALQPIESAWHSELATIYKVADQFDAALPHLQQAAELAPEDGQILVALARAYRSNGQLSDAEEMYARSLQFNPASPKVWKEAGQVALDSGDNDRAEAWFQRACTLLPTDASCVIGAARSAQQLGKTKQALEKARQAYDLAPDDPLVLSGLGDILAANGSLDKAVQIYDRALRISEHSPDIRLSRSKLLMEAGRPQESITDLEQLVEINPDHHEAWESLARAYAHCNEFEAGINAAQQAVNISPRSVDYRLLMSRLCRQAGQLDQALDILIEIEMEAPERADVAREKGMVHENRREFELALDAYNRALSIDAYETQTVIRAGLLLKQLKAYEESAALLERGTELMPDDANLHQQLAAVRALQFVHGNQIDQQVVAP